MALLPSFIALKRLLPATALASTLAVSGCCGNFLVSERFGHAVDQGAAADCPDGQCGSGRIGGQRELPKFCWPGWLQRDHWASKHRRVKDEFAEMLQPGPPPPVKPPHSRFHPVPTLPVFASRAEYRPPELLGGHPGEETTTAPTPAAPANSELIPTPTAESATPIWQAPTAPQLIPAPHGNDEPEAIPPAAPTPPADPTKGPVAQASYQSPSPNPLRSGK
ncbi:MAG TPA: hypothetical protein VL096_20150 [Pirellulaceae bacterium]|nr:hypothetical protein [Pirellulaceae bacterium]